MSTDTIVAAAKTCSNCGTPLRPMARFCGQCGGTLFRSGRDAGDGPSMALWLVAPAMAQLALALLMMGAFARPTGGTWDLRALAFPIWFLFAGVLAALVATVASVAGGRKGRSEGYMAFIGSVFSSAVGAGLGFLILALKMSGN